MNRRVLLHLLITLFVLAVANGMIFQKERLLRSGTSMLLRLAPVDPRSLMQGDYMALRYAISRELVEKNPTLPAAGRVVVHLGEHGIATLVRLDRGEPLAPGEHYLKYSVTNGVARLGAESFFFQEGQSERFAKAWYGELKVAPNGSSVLVGLCDEAAQPIALTPPAGAAVSPAR